MNRADFALVGIATIASLLILIPVGVGLAEAQVISNSTIPITYNNGTTFDQPAFINATGTFLISEYMENEYRPYVAPYVAPTYVAPTYVAPYVAPVAEIPHVSTDEYYMLDGFIKQLAKRTTVGENYILIENFETGEATWTSTIPKILDGYTVREDGTGVPTWKNYVIDDVGSKIIFNSNSVGGLVYDESSCSYSIQENGFNGDTVVPSVSAVATGLVNGEWTNLSVNNESCVVDVTSDEEGIIITSTKTNTETTFVQVLDVNVNSGIKETWKVTNDDNTELGISQTVHTGATIDIAGQVIDIEALNGQSFDQQYITENTQSILEITDSINYEFSTAIRSLTDVNIIHEGDYKVNLDYAGGFEGNVGVQPFIGYLEIDPTFSVSSSTGTWGTDNDFDLSGLPVGTVVLSGTAGIDALDATDIATILSVSGSSTPFTKAVPNTQFTDKNDWQQMNIGYPYYNSDSGFRNLQLDAMHNADHTSGGQSGDSFGHFPCYDCATYGGSDGVFDTGADIEQSLWLEHNTIVYTDLGSPNVILQTSSDGSTWTTAETFDYGSNGYSYHPTELTELTGTFRYMKFIHQNTGYDSWWGLNWLASSNLNNAPTLSMTYLFPIIHADPPTSLVATDGLPTSLAWTGATNFGTDGYGDANTLLGYSVATTQTQNSMVELPDNSGTNAGVDFTANEFLLHGFEGSTSSTAISVVSGSTHTVYSTGGSSASSYCSTWEVDSSHPQMNLLIQPTNDSGARCKAPVIDFSLSGITEPITSATFSFDIFTDDGLDRECYLINLPTQASVSQTTFNEVFTGMDFASDASSSCQGSGGTISFNADGIADINENIANSEGFYSFGIFYGDTVQDSSSSYGYKEFNTSTPVLTLSSSPTLSDKSTNSITVTAPSFGGNTGDIYTNTATSTGSATNGNTIFLGQLNAGVDEGDVITKVGANFWSTSAMPHDTKFVVYSDNSGIPDKFLFMTNEGNIGSTGYHSFDVLNPRPLTASESGNLWVGCWSSANCYIYTQQGTNGGVKQMDSGTYYGGTTEPPATFVHDTTHNSVPSHTVTLGTVSGSLPTSTTGTIGTALQDPNLTYADSNLPDNTDPLSVGGFVKLDPTLPSVVDDLTTDKGWLSTSGDWAYDSNGYLELDPIRRSTSAQSIYIDVQDSDYLGSGNNLSDDKWMIQLGTIDVTGMSTSGVLTIIAVSNNLSDSGSSQESVGFDYGYNSGDPFIRMKATSNNFEVNPQTSTGLSGTCQDPSLSTHFKWQLTRDGDDYTLECFASTDSTYSTVLETATLTHSGLDSLRYIKVINDSEQTNSATASANFFVGGVVIHNGYTTLPEPTGKLLGLNGATFSVGTTTASVSALQSHTWDSSNTSGFTINGASLTKTASSTWGNNYARSADSFTVGSGAFEVSGTIDEGSSHDGRIGFNTGTVAGNNYNDYEWYADSGYSYVFEGNSQQFEVGNGALRNQGDIYTVKIDNAGEVTYYYNGVYQYTSTVTASGTYYIDSHANVNGSIITILGSQGTIISATGLVDNTSTAQHYSFTRDSSNGWTIYQNGVSQATVTDSTSLGANSVTQSSATITGLWGFIRDNDSSCDGVSTVKNGNFDYWSTGNSGTSYCDISYFEFDTSSIPTGVTITDSTLTFESENVYGTPSNCDFTSMGNTRTTDSGDNLWSASVSGDVLLSNDSACTTLGSSTVDLTTVGDSAITSKLGDGYFGIGFIPTGGVFSQSGGVDKLAQGYAPSDTDTHDKVTLTLTYSAPSDYTTNISGSLDEFFVNSDALSSTEITNIASRGVDSWSIIANPNDYVLSQTELPDGSADETSGGYVVTSTATSNADGTNYGATTGATGIIGKAWDFTTDDAVYVSIPSPSPNIDSSSTIWSMNTWVKLGTTDHEAFLTAGFGDGTAPDNNLASDRVDFRYHSGQDDFGYLEYGDAGGSGSYGMGNYDTTTTGWHMVTYVRDGLDWTHYINGVAGGTHTATASTLPSTGMDWRIGQGGYTPESWTSEMDEMSFWSKALTASEVSTLYNSGSANTPSSISTTGLTTYYNFEQTGNTLENVAVTTNPITMTGEELDFTNNEFLLHGLETATPSPGLETDFTSDAGWTSSSTSSLEVTNDELQYKNNYNGNYIYYDLGSVSDDKWLLQFKITFGGSPDGSDEPAFGFGLYDYIGDMNDSGDRMGMWGYFDRSDTWHRLYCTVADETTSVQGIGCDGTGDGQNYQSISIGTDYWVSMTRDGSTFESSIYTSDDYTGTPLVTLDNPSVPSTLDNLQYLTASHYVQGGGITAVIDDVTFYNGVTSAVAETTVISLSDKSTNDVTVNYGLTETSTTSPLSVTDDFSGYADQASADAVWQSTFTRTNVDIGADNIHVDFGASYTSASTNMPYLNGNDDECAVCHELSEPLNTDDTFTLQFKVSNVATTNPPNWLFEWGMGLSEKGYWNAQQDAVGIKYRANTSGCNGAGSGWYTFHANNINALNCGTNVDSSISMGNTWVEIERTSPTVGTIKLFSTDDFTASPSNSYSVNFNGITNLNYINFGEWDYSGNGGGVSLDIDDINLVTSKDVTVISSANIQPTSTTGSIGTALQNPNLLYANSALPDNTDVLSVGGYVKLDTASTTFEDDFTTDKSWTSSGFTNGNGCTVDITTDDRLELVRVDGTSMNNDRCYNEFGTTLSDKFVMQFKMNFYGTMNHDDNSSFKIWLSETLADNGESVGLYTHFGTQNAPTDDNYDGTYAFVNLAGSDRVNSDSQHDGASTVNPIVLQLDANPATYVGYYEFVKDTDSFTVTEYSDPSYTTVVSTDEVTDGEYNVYGTNHASGSSGINTVTNLDTLNFGYVGADGQGGEWYVAIDDIKIYNDVTTLPEPTGKLLGLNGAEFSVGSTTASVLGVLTGTTTQGYSNIGAGTNGWSIGTGALDGTLLSLEVKAGSALINDIIKDVKVTLYKNSSPNELVYVIVRDSGDNILAQANMDASTLTSSSTVYTFTLDSAVQLSSGDRVNVEYYGASSTGTVGLPVLNGVTPSTVNAQRDTATSGVYVDISGGRTPNWEFDANPNTSVAYGSFNIISATGLTDNTSTPQHYAFTRDASNLWSIYQNGVSQATATDSTSLGSNIGSSQTFAPTPSHEGRLLSNGATGSVCGTGVAQFNTDTGGEMYVPSSSSADPCYRIWYEYDISSIPSGSTITDTTITLNVVGTNSPKTCDISPIVDSPSTVRALAGNTAYSTSPDWDALWNSLSSATPYSSNAGWCQSSGSTTVDLGTTADSDITTDRSTGVEYVAFGLKSVGENSRDGSIHSTNTAVSPTLTITYSPPSSYSTNISGSLDEFFVNSDTLTSTEIAGISKRGATLDTVGTTSASTTTFDDSTVTGGTTYYYAIQAVNSQGAGTMSNFVSGLAGSPPGNPTAATTIDNPDTAPLVINVGITANANVGSGTLSNFEIYRDGVLIDTVGLVSTYPDTVPSGGGTFVYTLKAISDHGISGLSNESSITTATVPPTPNAPSMTITNPNPSPLDVDVSWTAQSSGGSAIVSYEIFRSATETGTYTSVGTVNDLDFTDTVTSPGTWYYKIASTNLIGSSGQSTSSSIATPTVPSSDSTTTLAINNPNPNPLDITVSFVAPSSDGGSTVTAYNLYSSPDDSAYTQVATAVTADQTITVANAGTWYFKSEAANNVGTASQGSAVSIATPTVPSASSTTLAINNPNPNPLDITATFVAPSSDGGSTVTAYNLYTSPNDGTYTPVATAVTGDQTITVANAGTWYFKSEAINNVGVGTLSAAVTIATPTVPSSDSSVTLAINNPNPNPLLITATFVAPSSDGGSTVTAYNLYYSDDDSTYSQVATAVTGSVDYTVTAAGTHYFQTQSINNVGTSAISSTVSIATPTVPDAPSVTLEIANPNPSPLLITSTFVAPSSDGGSSIINYNLYTSSDDSTYISIVNATTGTFDYTVSGPGTWFFKSEVTNNIGTSALSSAFNVTTATVPITITDLAASTVSDTAINLTWSVPNNGGSSIIDYTVFRDGVLVGTVTTAGFSDTGLTSQTSYAYTVYTRNNAGTSLVSNSVAQFTHGVPDQVTVFTATTASIDQLNLTWTPPNDYNSVITNYILERESPTGNGFTPLITLTSETSYSDPGLNSVQEYNYRITAVNAYGSGPTNTASAITLPAEPTGIVVTPNSSSSELIVTWNTPTLTSGITGYQILREDGVGTGFTPIIVAATSPFTDTGLTDNIYYNYKLRAVASQGYSGYSNTYSQTTFHLPTGVQSLTATSGDLIDAGLSWSSPAVPYGYITGYEIFQSTTGTPNVLIDSTTATSYTATDLDPTITYYWLVAPVTIHGTNSTGNIANATATSEIVIGDIIVSKDVNPIQVPINFKQIPNGNSTDLTVTYATGTNLSCEFDHKFARTNYTHGSLSETFVSTTKSSHTFTFNNSANEIISVHCYDQDTNPGGDTFVNDQTDGKDQINFAAQPIVTQVNDFQKGAFGISSGFGAFDLMTLFVVLISMVGFNRKNPTVGIGIMVSFIGAMGYFGIIEPPTIVMGILAVVVVVSIGQVRKNR